MVVTSLLHSGIPVDPDRPDAQRMLQDELAEPVYTSAEPTAFDLTVRDFLNWIGSLLTGANGDLGPLLLALAVAAVIAVVVVALLVFGAPRLRRRARPTTELFGVDEFRTADELRRSADEAAAAGRWTAAIEHRYRALARALAERTIVTVSPGTTAHAFAIRASNAFPDQRAGLAEAADLFDGVRYLGRTGTAEAYAVVTNLDNTLATASPTTRAPVVSAVVT